MSNPDAFFMRWRVRLGYPLAVAVLALANPSPHSILWGACIGMIGLALRAYAAGYLHKQEVLTVTGPYAYTRNPLYLGSAILALGVVIAAWSWLAALILVVYFALFYSVVMRREARELRARHAIHFDEYAQTVPLFFPRLARPKSVTPPTPSFSTDQYKKNHEWQAALGFCLVLVVLIMIWYFRYS